MKDLLPEYLLGSLEPEDVERVEEALASSRELRREAEAWRRVLFSLPESLEPAPVGDDEWERLRSATFGADLAEERPADGYGAKAPRARQRAAAAWLRPPWSGVLLAACLVLVAAVGAWGWNAGQDHLRLAEEQRIIAYWMRHPDLQIQALAGVGPGAVAPGAERPELPPGVVCVLPDGRAMVLQPYAPPVGTRYVVRGFRDGERVELAAGRQRLLLFDATGLSGIEVAVDGRGDAVVAEARF